ncbi:MAG: alpha/beta fold hydrolase [Nannocystaceae bacterium]
MNTFAASLALSLLAVSAAACSPYQTEGEFMFLRQDDAELPIWVRGNLDSGTIVIWLSPGPGDPIEALRGEGTDLLEQHVGVVYWDQRGCGTAQGNPAPESFTVDQFVADTDAVVELVRQRYHPQHVFLLGHSWGGTLATAYLLDAKRQAKITGFIDLAGNHDFPTVFPMKLAWLQDYAEQQLARGHDVGHWRGVRDWAASRPPLGIASFDHWVGLVDETNAAFFDPDQDVEVSFDLVFRSGGSALAYLQVNRDFVVDSLYRDDAAMRAIAFRDKMHRITVPVLALWGRNDGIVPLAAADDALAHLGTPAARRERVVIERAGHVTFLEQPQAFADAAADFIARTVAAAEASTAGGAPAD